MALSRDVVEKNSSPVVGDGVEVGVQQEGMERYVIRKPLGKDYTTLRHYAVDNYPVLIYAVAAAAANDRPVQQT